MSNNQLFAKIGVFALLGLNVGAYYVFWPSNEGGSKTEAKPPNGEKGEVQLLPAPKDAPKPKEISPASLRDAVPLSIPGSGKIPEETSADEAVSRLLDHIKKETEAQIDPAKKPDLPAAPLFPQDNKPNPLPPFKADPLQPDPGNPNVGVTSAVTPKVPPAPWLLHMETVGNQTLLTAKLRHPGSLKFVADFRILCDRVEMKNQSGDVQAVGRVTFTGAGLNGACQRLTLPVHETRVVFEEQVFLSQDAVAGSHVRGERMIWELPLNDANPAVLGAPK